MAIYQSIHSGEFIDEQISAVSQKLSIDGTAVSANKLATSRTINLTGDVTGSISFDGSADVSITTAVSNNSHTHTWSNISDRASCTISTSGNITGTKVYGAVWNDYAEYRICKDNFKPGQVVVENGDDTLSISNTRLQRGCSLISDTFGFAIGETDEAKCPVAVSGRVLAYPYEPKEEFRNHIGWPVCAGPDGTVSIMTEEEEEKYPSRIIGTISAVPDYEYWGTGNIKVNDRIWIKVR